MNLYQMAGHSVNLREVLVRIARLWTPSYLGDLFPQRDAEDFRNIATIATIASWGQWGFLAVGFFLLLYRPPWGTTEQMAYAVLLAAGTVGNIILHVRARSTQPLTWHWLVGISVLQWVIVTLAVIVGGGFASPAYVLFYPILVFFAVAVTSSRVSFTWAAIVAAGYIITSVTVGDGIDYATGAEEVLVLRVAGMFLVVVGANLVTRLERTGRQQALERERQLQQERIELSQTIHDTTAQAAYMIGLGLENAIELTDESNEELLATLRATATLSKSAMWELRRPIDTGHLWEGRALGGVLRSHTATFTSISSVPAEFTQAGAEPVLPTPTRTRMFAIAHNALTNALRHANATRVDVQLAFGKEEIRLSVADDGDGLPADYERRGHGFRNMRADAEHLGGALVVESAEPTGGTTVTCVIPIQSQKQGG